MAAGPDVRRIRITFALAVLLVAPACAGDGALPEGDALESNFKTGYGIPDVRPGQEFIVMLGTLSNETDDPVRILALEPISDPGFERVLEVSYEIAPRRADLAPIPGGLHVTDPPVERDGESCAVQPLVSPADWTVPVTAPGDDVSRGLIATRVVAKNEGTTRLDGIRVEYQAGGGRYFQVVPMVYEIEVRDDARPLRIPTTNRPCLRRVRVRSLELKP